MVGWSVEGKCKIDSCSFKVRHLPSDTQRLYRKSQSDGLKGVRWQRDIFGDPNGVNVSGAEESRLHEGKSEGEGQTDG